jgi:hypothetical protein
VTAEEARSFQEEPEMWGVSSAATDTSEDKGGARAWGMVNERQSLSTMT